MPACQIHCYLCPFFFPVSSRERTIERGGRGREKTLQYCFTTCDMKFPPTGGNQALELDSVTHSIIHALLAVLPPTFVLLE